MNFKLHHVAFTVRDAKESIKWYQEKLGCEVIHQYEKHGMEITHLRLGGVRLELFSYGENTQPLPEYRKDLETDLHIMGTKHLCIEVENLEMMIAGLKEKGVVFTTEIDTAGFGGRYVFFRDCNGILIELYQA